MNFIPQFLTVTVASIVAWIAYQQFALARERFKLDLFEKRFAVFEATKKFLFAISKEAQLDLDDLSQFQQESQQATFLFGSEIGEYLKSLVEKALEMRDAKFQSDRLPKGPEHSAFCKRETKLLKELTDEHKNLGDRFAPYLRFEAWKPSGQL